MNMEKFHISHLSQIELLTNSGMGKALLLTKRKGFFCRCDLRQLTSLSLKVWDGREGENLVHITLENMWKFNWQKTNKWGEDYKCINFIPIATLVAYFVYKIKTLFYRQGKWEWEVKWFPQFVTWLPYLQTSDFSTTPQFCSLLNLISRSCNISSNLGLRLMLTWLEGGVINSKLPYKERAQLRNLTSHPAAWPWDFDWLGPTPASGTFPYHLSTSFC